MNPIVKNILAVIAGIVIGSLVNMGLVMSGHAIISPPEGFDPMDMESLKENIHLFQPKHFVFPFLAHALGTLVGAFLAAKLAVSHKMKFALGIGAFFLLGGIINTMTLGGPTWFNALDIILAYIPMGWLGGKIACAGLTNTET